MAETKHTGLDFVLILVGACVFTVIMAFLGSSGRHLASPQEESQAVVVLRDLAAGKPVSKNDFESVFPPGDSMTRDMAIRHASMDLGISYEEVKNVVWFENLSIVYTGPQDKIPAKLRPATRPATAQTDVPE